MATMLASVAVLSGAGAACYYGAREAGLSRVLLHYYFASKEQLLVEVVRHDCDVKIEAMEARLSRADSVDAIVQALVYGLEEFVEEEPGSQAVTYEMLSAS